MIGRHKSSKTMAERLRSIGRPRAVPARDTAEIRDIREASRRRKDEASAERAESHDGREFDVVDQASWESFPASDPPGWR